MTTETKKNSFGYLIKPGTINFDLHQIIMTPNKQPDFYKKFYNITQLQNGMYLYKRKERK